MTRDMCREVIEKQAARIAELEHNIKLPSAAHVLQITENLRLQDRIAELEQQLAAKDRLLDLQRTSWQAEQDIDEATIARLQQAGDALADAAGITPDDTYWITLDAAIAAWREARHVGGGDE